MPVTRYRQGNATITLTGDVEAHVRRLIDAAGDELFKLAVREAEAVAAEARRQWYALVDKESGKSGTIDVVTTVDPSRGTFEVAVGSTDDRKAKNGKPTVVYVHAPGPSSLVKVQVTQAEYWSTPEGLRANYAPFPDDKGTGPYVYKVNPKAGNGRGLLQSLIKGPMKARVKAMAPEVRAAVAARLRNVAGGGR